MNTDTKITFRTRTGASTTVALRGDDYTAKADAVQRAARTLLGASRNCYVKRMHATVWQVTQRTRLNVETVMGTLYEV